MKRFCIWALTFICLVAFSSAASPVYAKQKKKKSQGGAKTESLEDQFKKMDVNGDDKLTEEEVTAGKKGKEAEKAKKDFKHWDTNQDGKVIPREFKSTIKFDKANGK